MFKIEWFWSDGLSSFALVPDIYAAFALHWVITGYGRDDGFKPLRVLVTNLDGEVVDMSGGVRAVAGRGTYSKISW